MQYIQHKSEIEITGLEDFDLQQTFDCGQCFRWNPAGDGAYIGVAFGRAVRIRREGGSVYLWGTVADFESLWRDYFDFDRDYGDIRRRVSIDAYMKQAADFGAGIRILRQDPWEALCSFILSQCNNIPRIKQITEQLCKLFGEPVCLENSMYYAFPAADRLAGLTAEALAPCRCGYRADSVLEAARAVAEGRLDLAALSRGTPEDALETLKTLRGVGDKVASCVVLFGLHMLNAFPVDTWIKKVIDTRYGGTFDPAVFSPYAGIAQQYMFYYARSGKEGRQSA
jgi:N-glycosylase/DNA lyase